MLSRGSSVRSSSVFGVKLEETTGVVDNTVNVDEVVPGSERKEDSSAVEDGVCNLSSLLDRRLAVCCDEAGTVDWDGTASVELVLGLSATEPADEWRSDWLGLFTEHNGATKAPVDSAG